MSMDVERVVGELNDRLRFSHGRHQESKLELVNIKTEAARKLRNAEVNVQTLKGELKFIKEEFGQRVVDIQGLQNELKQRNINENQQREKMAEKDALIQTLRQQAAERDAHVSALTQYATWLRDEVQRRGESVCEHGEHVKRLTCQATKNDLEVNGLRERMAHRSKIEEEKRKLLEGKLEDAHKKIVGLKEQKSCLQSTCQEKHEILVAENDRLRQKVSDLQFRLASRPLSRLPRQTTRVPLCVVEEKIDSVLEDCGKTCYLEAEHDEVVKRARKESKNVDVFYGKHVPAVVVQAFQEMVDQPDGRISIEDIDTTILAVDLIYQRSMRKKTAELRAKHMQEMGEVHQKIKERAPYTQIICADKVRYLKKQLTDAQKRRGPMHGDGAKMMKVLLDKAFCMAVEYDRLKEQNVTLQATLDEDECRLRMRHAFCRGTVWLSKKMLGALQRGEDKLLRVVAPEGKVDLTARHDAMEAHVQNVQTATEDVFRDLKNQVTSLPTPADVCWMED